MMRNAVLRNLAVALLITTHASLAGPPAEYEVTANSFTAATAVTIGDYELFATVGEYAVGEVTIGDYTLSGGIVPVSTPPGCGACQLHADVFPFTDGAPNTNTVGNCVVDLDDILTILSAFSAKNQCGPDFPDAVNLFPCSQACPDGVVDLDDILSTLSAFSGDFSCDHPCLGGACCFGDSSCQDWDGVGAGATPIGGMSLTTCSTAGGMYQGDGTTCDEVTCP